MIAMRQTCQTLVNIFVKLGVSKLTLILLEPVGDIRGNY